VKPEITDIKKLLLRWCRNRLAKTKRYRRTTEATDVGARYAAGIQHLQLQSEFIGRMETGETSNRWRWQAPVRKDICALRMVVRSGE
jgi:hypothetical protein